MRRVAVLGATGRLGDQVVVGALEAGLEVNALVRDPRKVSRFNERFTMFKGDAATGAGLAEALDDCTMVVCSIGSRRPIQARCMANLVGQLAGRRLEVLLYVSWLLPAAPPGPWGALRHPLAQLNRLLRAPPLDDLAAAEALLRQSRLPHVILRPADLTDACSGTTVVGGEPGHQRGISRPDFARFIISMLLRPEWVGEDLTVGSLPT